MIPWMTCLPDESDVSIQKITIIVKKVGMGVDSDVDYQFLAHQGLLDDCQTGFHPQLILRIIFSVFCNVFSFSAYI